MSGNRGMSVSQAKTLASDPKTTQGVLTRLANSYPEVWDDLLANPSTSTELTEWIRQAKEQALAAKSAVTENLINQGKAVKKAKPVKVKRVRSRGRRSYGRIIRSIASLIVPGLAIYGLFTGLNFLEQNQPAKGIVVTETLFETVDEAPWVYDLRVDGEPSCAIYQFSAIDQNQAMVLVQNDIEKKKCRNLEDPIPSTLALVDLVEGKEIWKIDLAGELDWTQKWLKQLVEIPGMNEILVKFTDVNGRDAGNDSKSIDKTQNRKMKTLVPYNRLNGLITDPVIAKSKYQPIMQAPVLEVLPIPGNLRSILVMTNGSKEDFRYAKYRSKRLSSARWSVESDLKPMGGIPVVGQLLVLGRDKKDKPQAIRLGSGKFTDWNGSPAVKLYTIAGDVIEVAGDGVSEKVTNVASQGGTSGHKIRISGLDGKGNETWTTKGRGYALSRDDSLINPTNRLWYGNVYLLSGKNNQKVSLVDPKTGEPKWTTKISKPNFEISRVNSQDTVSIYISKDVFSEAKSMAFLNLADGVQSSSKKIRGDQVRVDGAAESISVVVDEPERKVAVKNANNGKRTSVTNASAVAVKSNTCANKFSVECLGGQKLVRVNGKYVLVKNNSVKVQPQSIVRSPQAKASSKKIRTCAQGVDNETFEVLWDFECTKNQHVTKVAGRWILVDLSDGGQKFWPLRKGN